MADITIFSPDAMGKPLGMYKQMSKVSAQEYLFIAGQLATNKNGEIVGKDDFDAQFEQVFANIETALRSEGLGFGNVVRFTTFLVDARHIEAFMELRARHFPTWFAEERYPPNTLLVVNRLVKEEFLLEVDTIAAR